MNVTVLKSNGKKIISTAINRLKKEHIGIESLKEKVSTKRCQSPDLVDDYLLWVTLEKNQDNEISFEESIEYHHPWIFDTLTEKRLDMLRHITVSEPRSIKTLATELGRDYKNVYDDLLALNNSGLIDFMQEGRRKRPIGIVKQIRITIF